MRTNVATVARDLERLGRDFTTPVARGLEDYGEVVVSRAGRRGYGFRDRTGRLRRSIGLDRTMVSGDRVVVPVGSDIDYAGAVEYGRGGRHSYLRRALRDTERQVDAAVDRRIGQFIRQRNF